ncbi:relaxosome protein TraM (plasmid) [Kosakonia sp. ML.JS2a]|uniref:relaxosome protein TraM n=1 Tax=Kosakonia sp. ML.JS2a TaxID=2980557 RepID=UPI0021DB12FD|nr:relaxosome protein TraM [Kosakonia sp. ML.JS2a]UXY13582.1 relaxosome protein TraM [Kosakonia sp. ML.JS2a]
MGRVGIYLKDKIEREVRDIVQMDLQNGANPSEANISATCNELIRLGLLVYKKNDGDGNNFNLEGFRRDLIKKVSGSREGMMILTALISEIYVELKGDRAPLSLEDLINNNISAINTAENMAETQHFLVEEN